MSRLVIVAPNWLGDAVMALPAIADIRRASPEMTIAVAARPAVASLFAMVPDVDEVIEKVERGDGSRFDAALLLPNSFRSALDVTRAGIRERWGYRADCRRPLLTRAVRRARELLHQVEYYQHLANALGYPSGPAQPRLQVKSEVRDAGARALAAAGWDGAAPLAAIAPGAAYGGAKRWPPAYFAELALALAREGIRTVTIGSAADEPTRLAIDAALGHGRTTMLNLVGRTDVPTLAGVLTHTRGLFANDSGTMHLGAAIGVPVTAIFGPTDERLTAPRSAAPSAVLSHPVWCRPCMLRECPLDHRCMRGVPVAAVADAARRMM